jgi:hypothetical protein
MRSWLGLGVTGGVVGLIAVASSGACSSAAAPYPTPESFCAAVASAQCQTPDGGLGIPGQCSVSADQCTSAVEMQCMSAATSATADGTRVYTQANVPACIAATLAAYGGPSITFAALQSVIQVCDAVFAGTVALGGSCSASASCIQPSEGGAGTVVCAPSVPGSTASTAMQCANSVPVAAGGGCNNPGDTCAAGSYCAGRTATTNASCQAGGSVAASCNQTVGCAVGAYCNISPGAKSGSCIAGGGAGQACGANADCGASAPLCDTNVAPPAGSTGIGSCVAALTFATGADDCKQFGATR